MLDSPLTFARPLWLYAGPVVCLLVAWLFTRFDRRREADLAKLVHPRFRSRLLPGTSPKLLKLKRAFWLTGLLCCFVAVAGPRKGFEFREVKRRGIDLLFAVDTSRSMLAEDLTPNRLERARLGIHDFVGRLEGDRIGLIPFAGSAYALCPLTSDYEAFRESLDALNTDLIPRQGTDVASAINEAARLFDEQGNNHRILVLITDGEDLQGDALEAAKEEAKKGMTIYLVGVGSISGQTIPVRLPNGRMDVIRDQSGNPVITKLDESTLRRIAEATNGLYVAMGRGAEGLDTIYREKLRLVPKNETEGRMEKVPLERYEWPLAVAVFCLLMDFLLPDRRRPRQTDALPSAARRVPIPGRPTALLAAGLLPFLHSPPAHAESADARILYNQGTEAYAAGDFRNAADVLRSSLGTTDLSLQNRVYYNLGNALYRLGQSTQTGEVEATLKSWEEAIKAYQDAATLNPDDRDARFNQEVVKRKLEELKKQNPDKDKKKDDQKKQDQKKDDQKEDDKKKDEGKQDGEKQDGDPKDGKPEEESKEGEKKDGQKPGEEQDEKGKKKGEGSESEKKEDKEGKEQGDSAKEGKEDKEGKEKGAKPGEEGEQKDGEKQQGEEQSSIEERRQAQQMQMTPEEAKQLLNMMRHEQRTVVPIERQPQGRFIDPNNTTKGKTW